MKKLIALLILLSLVQHAYAQKIRFTDTSNKWLVKRYKLGFPPITNLSFSYTDTANIDTFTYQEIPFGRFIREDTTAGKVYVRLSGWSNNIDSSEQVLYDYTLVLGDTFRISHYLHDTSTHYVYKIDSVSINGVFHRIWHMLPTQPPTSQYGRGGYAVIEGIGASGGPFYALNPVNFEQGYRLYCFHNGGNIITVPESSILMGQHGKNFLSPETCAAVDVSDIPNSENGVTISSHPANAVSVMRFQPHIGKGSLVVFNSLGQQVYHKRLTNTSSIRISDIVGHPGIYFYRASDEENQNVFSGKLLVEGI